MTTGMVIDLKRRRHSATPTSDVVGRHRVGEGDVRAGVEAVGQLVGVVVEVALHGVASVAKGLLTLLRFTPEPHVELELGPVREVGDASGDAHADVRPIAVAPPRGSRHPATSGQR